MRLRPRSAERNTSPANPVSRATRRTRKSTMAVTKRLATNWTPTRKIASPTKASKRTPWKNQKTRSLTARATNKQPQTLAERGIAEPAFPKFSKFPPELRNTIWELMLPPPRVIRILAHWEENTSQPGAQLKAEDASVPVVLHVNKESRGSAKRFYTLTFENQLHRGPIYFDFNRDTMFLPREADLNYFSTNISMNPEITIEDSVRFVAYGQEIVDTQLLKVFRWFSKVETLAVRKLPEMLENLPPGQQGLIERTEKDYEERFSKWRTEVASARNVPFTVPKIYHLTKEEFTVRYLPSCVKQSGTSLRTVTLRLETTFNTYIRIAAVEI
ncbi:uncharacterized protein K444DRAFT_147887 [Hyaloscypha bicolor E]|uniref:2EXR domain-containing protein n=1 Tax=Hyaloscypha bicolor E TaxID=1095630 RepID=A0A2J6SRR7_9HELO|nr:uncharacterized protein K444DRAFT_147887 [Hyaloscypha bicolor E]PMD53452.1 hypothetical protein K444DRAFT_147887 [Hyaloscypha bicolor E]